MRGRVLTSVWVDTQKYKDRRKEGCECCSAHIRNASSGLLMWLSLCGNMLLCLDTSDRRPHMSTLSCMKPRCPAAHTSKNCQEAILCSLLRCVCWKTQKSDNCFRIKLAGHQPICTYSVSERHCLSLLLTWYLLLSSPEWMLLLLLSFVQLSRFENKAAIVTWAFQSTWKTWMTWSSPQSIAATTAFHVVIVDFTRAPVCALLCFPRRQNTYHRSKSSERCFVIYKTSAVFCQVVQQSKRRWQPTGWKIDLTVCWEVWPVRLM